MNGEKKPPVLLKKIKWWVAILILVFLGGLAMLLEVFLIK